MQSRLVAYPAVVGISDTAQEKLQLVIRCYSRHRLSDIEAVERYDLWQCVDGVFRTFVCDEYGVRSLKRQQKISTEVSGIASVRQNKYSLSLL